LTPPVTHLCLVNLTNLCRQYYTSAVKNGLFTAAVVISISACDLSLLDIGI